MADGIQSSLPCMCSHALAGEGRGGGGGGGGGLLVLDELDLWVTAFLQVAIPGSLLVGSFYTLLYIY